MYVISYDITSDRLRNKIAKVLLGYHFSSMGKSVPTKAVQGLQDRLETMWLTSDALSI